MILAEIFIQICICPIGITRQKINLMIFCSVVVVEVGTQLASSGFDSCLPHYLF
jgi:hypothetical protein